MTLAERRQREKDKRRESIINAASRLFFKKGYEKVTMDDIAGEAELGKATLYTYFKDKDSIFFAVVNYGTKILISLIKEEEERLQNAGVKFGAIKAASRRFVLEYPNYARASFHFRSGKFELLSAIDNTDAKEVIEFNKKCYEEGIQEIKTGMENEIIRSDLSPVALTALNILLLDIFSSINPDLREVLNDNGITIQQFFQEVMDFLECTTETAKKNMNTGEINQITEEKNENACQISIPNLQHFIFGIRAIRELILVQ
jgi:AcrR family transcriptional regulator